MLVGTINKSLEKPSLNVLFTTDRQTAAKPEMKIPYNLCGVDIDLECDGTSAISASADGFL